MAPQLIFIALIFTSLLLNARDHGKPKKGKDNFWYPFTAAVIYFILLYLGGFFDVFIK